ncbi:MAG: hypothetical protein IKU45_00140 [Clostridia bacterium]|nr:hypothetical protein [Clostridia bacterium]
MQLPDFSFLSEYKGLSLTLILVSFLIGITLASVAMIYHQTFLGGIIRKIIEKGALSPEKALTLDELGYNSKNIFVKFALRENSTFRKHVKSPEDDKTKYYIPEEKRLGLEIRFRKKGNEAIGIVFTIILFAIAAFVLLTVIPWLVNQAKDII